MYIVVIDDTLYATNIPEHESECEVFLTDRIEGAWIIDNISAEVVAGKFRREGYKVRIFNVRLNVEILGEYDYLNEENAPS